MYPCELSPEFLNIPFVSGAGIILSRDVAEIFLKENHTLDKYKVEMPDDVFIGMFFQKKNIPPQPALRIDIPNRDIWLEGQNNIPPQAFHFRAKSHQCFRTAEESFADELFILHALLKRFYQKGV